MESWVIRDEVAAECKGEIDVSCIDSYGNRVGLCDVVTEEYAIQVCKIQRWKKGYLDVLRYASLLQKKPILYLFDWSNLFTQDFRDYIRTECRECIVRFREEKEPILPQSMFSQIGTWMSSWFSS